MWAVLDAARGWVRSLWSVWPAEGSGRSTGARLAEVEAADPSGDDHPLLRLLRLALQDGDDAAADRALDRLAKHYASVGAWEKAVAVLTQQVARHPEDEAATAALEAAHLALGHRGDAARVAPRTGRGRVEVVHVAPDAAEQDDLRDTLPISRAEVMAGIEAADTDVDAVPRPEPAGDATVPVDKKMLDLLRRLSS